jgi:large subunit ribosomal protein L35
MPKVKTNRSAAKRFRVTATGKLRRKRAYRSHLLLGKSRKRKRRLRRPALVSSADRRRVERMLALR